MRLAIRRSFRCDCVERWDRKPLRRTLPVLLEDDPGERILAGIEKATGERPPGCPWRMLREPFVAAVMRAHRWWSKSQLAEGEGERIPYALKVGIDTYDAALNAVRVYDARKERERREAERKNREAQPSPLGGGRRRR